MTRDYMEFVDWLSERFSGGYRLQLGLANAGKVALAWLPGAKQKSKDWSLPRDGVVYLGCSTRGYQSYYTPMIEQPCELAGATIDIDGKDNPSISLAMLQSLVISAVEGAGSVRTSCSGKGLHVFFRLGSPISIEAGVPSKDISAIARAISAPWADKIRAAGVAIDKVDSRLMWVSGGKNEWIYRTNAFVEWQGNRIVEAPKIPAQGVAQAGTSPFVETWLARLGIRSGPCNVATIVERLRDAGEYAQTGSQRRDRMNGEIRVEQGWIGLWAWADKRYIWQASEL